MRERLRDTPASKDLVHNYFYNFCSQILTQFAPLITTPYLARVLHEAGNGQIAFVNSLVTYFVYFSEFGFSTYGQREIAKCGDDREKRSLIFVEIMILKLVFTAFALAAYIGLTLSPLIDRVYKPLLMINALQIVGSAGDIRFYYTGTENFRVIARRTMLFRVAIMVMVFALIRREDQVWLYLLCFSASVLVSNLVLWPSMLRNIEWTQIRNAVPKRHLKSSFYVFLPVIAITIFNNIDSTMIGFLADNADHENGCYFAALNLMNLFSVLLTVDTLVLASRNARDYQEKNERDLKRHLNFSFAYVWELAFPLTAVILVAAEHISHVYFGPGYEATPAILRIFTIQIFAHGLFSLLGNQYFIQTDREKMCMLVNFAGIGFNIILDLMLVSSFGGIGVAVASVLSEALMAGLLFSFFIREQRYWDQQMLRSMLKPALASAIMLIPMFAIEWLMQENMMSLVLLLMAGGITYCLSLYIMRDSFFLRYSNIIIQYLNPVQNTKRGNGIHD